jgi:hypothetical protein
MKNFFAKIKDFTLKPTKKSIVGLFIIASTAGTLNWFTHEGINEQNQQLENTYNDSENYYTIDQIKNNLNDTIKGNYQPLQPKSESNIYFFMLNEILKKENIEKIDFNNKTKLHEMLKEYVHKTHDNSNTDDAKLNNRYNTIKASYANYLINSFDSQELTKGFNAYQTLNNINQLLLNNASQKHESTLNETLWKENEAQYTESLKNLKEFHHTYLLAQEKNNDKFFKDAFFYSLNILLLPICLLFFPNYSKKSIGYKKIRQRRNFFDRLNKPSRQLLANTQKEIKKKTTLPSYLSKDYITYTLNNIKWYKEAFFYRNTLPVDNNNMTNNKKEKRHILDKLFISLPILSIMYLFLANPSVSHSLGFLIILAFLVFARNMSKEDEVIHEYIKANYTELSKEYPTQILNLLLGQIDAQSEKQLNLALDQKTKINLSNVIESSEDEKNMLQTKEGINVVNVKEKEVKYLKNSA